MVLIVLLLLAVGIWLYLSASKQRETAGFGAGQTVSRDDVILRSQRLGLVGKPDRIVQLGSHYIPEEKKPGRRVYETYKAQMGVYLLLVEEHYGVRPPYGILVLDDGRRVEIRNTERLRQWVLRIAQDIREHRQNLPRPLPPPESVAKCRGCGHRQTCTQRLV